MATLAPLQHGSLGEALARLRETIAPLSATGSPCAVEKALGGLLFQDITARRNVPHYRASAVDGYALKALTTAGASPARPVNLTPERYSWVNTGGIVNACYDAVIMVEDTSLNDEILLVSKPLTVGANVRPPGEDVMKGQVIARRGDPVTPQLQALLRAAGVEEIPLRTLPRTLYLPTGDEIVSPDRADLLIEGTVPETNSTLLRGLFQQWGYPLDVGDILPDDFMKLRRAIESAIDHYDLILVGAGSAKGKRDHTAEVFSSLGEILFRWVRTRPGRPAMAAKIKGKPVVCMPGFPMSSAVIAFAIVYPLLRHLEDRWDEGEGSLFSQATGTLVLEEAELLMSHSSSPGVEEWLRCQVAQIGGRKFVWPIAGGASSMWAMAEADGLVIIPEEKLECPKGMQVLLHRVKKVSLTNRILFQGSNDPALERVGSYLRSRGADMVLRSVGSVAGLAALARQEGHVAACHLIDPQTGRYNDSYIERFQGDATWRRVLLFFRQQGLIVAKGNPKEIRSVDDFARSGVILVNRQPGAGTRVLLDHLLNEHGIAPVSVQGYGKQCLTHLDAASRVAAGLADVALGIRSAAEAMDLDFLPITEEPYELVYPDIHENHPGIVALLSVLSDPQWRAEVEGLGGYRWND